MSQKEATARIKINKLLEAAGWRFFPDGQQPANVRLEPTIVLKQSDLDQFGENFEKTPKGMIDFLLQPFESDVLGLLAYTPSIAGEQ